MKRPTQAQHFYVFSINHKIVLSELDMYFWLFKTQQGWTGLFSDSSCLFALLIELSLSMIETQPVYLSSVYTSELRVLDTEATKWMSAQQIIVLSTAILTQFVMNFKSSVQEKYMCSFYS
jgi:hypothetical protein